MHMSSTQSLRPTTTRQPTGHLTQEVILVGDRRYRVGPVLHISGLSAVYLGTELRSGEDVIVKEVSYHNWTFTQQAHARSLLTHEGKVLRLLERWNIPAPRYRDCILFQERTYLIMSRVVGKPLNVLAEAGQITPARAIVLVIALANLVEELHAHGYLHHDIKLENIIVQPDGQPILIDYGSAQQIRAAGDCQLTGTGTIEFMSIEQARGEARASNDVFALGRTLEYLIPQPEPHIADVIARATAPLTQRYQRAAELRSDLQRIRAHDSWSAPARWRCRIFQATPYAGMIAVVLMLCLIILPRLQTAILVEALRPAPVASTLVPFVESTSQVHVTPPVVHSSADYAISPPVNATALIQDCYTQYQQSREAVFRTLELERLQCVELDSPLWQYIEREVNWLKQHSLARHITQQSSIGNVAILPVNQAKLVVAKTDTRVDLLMGCDVAVPNDQCQPAHVVEDEKYTAIFYVHLTADGWQLRDVVLSQ